MSPAPSTKHQTVSRHLQFQLYSQLELTGRGKVFNAPTDVELSEHDIVQPDVLVIMKERQRIVLAKRIRGIPDLCIEILSESNPDADRVLKLEMYQRTGVPAYWIVDPLEESIDLYVLKDNSYCHTKCKENELKPTFIPDCVVTIDRIWME